jgi:alkanesulfonate monooxygenase SsuD/methylene tetrahydromethanopterin reductase-like flavin-dependent oxidoreductase (luciferase family)
LIYVTDIADQAARYGDGFFVNNLFMTIDYFARYVDFYRQRWAHFGHGRPEDAVVGAGGALYVRPRSQDAFREFAPYCAAHPGFSSSGPLEEAARHTGLSVGSPARVVDHVMSFRDHFGPYRRQLFGMDAAGVQEKTVHERIDLARAEVVPVLRREMVASPAAA